MEQSETKKEAFLLTLDNFLNSPREEYKKLIKKAEKAVWNDNEILLTPFSYLLEDRLMFTHDEDVDVEIDFFRKRLGKKILVNLGGIATGEFANFLGISTYICVDRYAYPDDIPADPCKNVDDKTIGSTHILYVKADMLDFISRIPDNSVSIQIDGIDNTIIPDENYQEALAKECMRVIEKDGLIFGNNSTALELISWELKRSGNKNADDFHSVRLPFVTQRGVKILEKS